MLRRRLDHDAAADGRPSVGRSKKSPLLFISDINTHERRYVGKGAVCRLRRSNMSAEIQLFERRTAGNKACVQNADRRRQIQPVQSGAVRERGGTEACRILSQRQLCKRLTGCERAGADCRNAAGIDTLETIAVCKSARRKTGQRRWERNFFHALQSLNT